MSSFIRLHKGLDIPLQGAPSRTLSEIPDACGYAVKPSDFRNLIPKLLVKEGDEVKAGTPLFVNKSNPDMAFCAPVGGVVSAVVRGEKRKLLAVVVKPGEAAAVAHPQHDLARMDRAQVVDLMLRSGCWPLMVQRPYGVLADPKQMPKAIFVSCFDTAPLAPDYAFSLSGEADLAAFREGVRVLDCLAPKAVHLSVPARNAAYKAFTQDLPASVHEVEGKHPAGNVGVQIHHIRPIGKGDVVWTLDPGSVVILGRLFLTGQYDPTRVLALTGAAVEKPAYVRCPAGACMGVFNRFLKASQGAVRRVSGNALSGTAVEADGFAGFYANQLTFLPEAEQAEFMGWARPLRLKKFSVAHTYPSFLFPKRKYNLDTCTNGGPRAFVMTSYYNRVLPMDIYPTYLLKAILAQDLDKMEALGMYEVLEEDLALCEFVCPSKIDIQSIVSRGIDLMIKEM